MRKVALLFTILLTFSSLFAGNLGPHHTQMIAGYIDYQNANFATLTITPDTSILNKSVKIDGVSFTGINLDISDTENDNIRYLISPSQSTDLSARLGLRIGTFKLEASNKNYELRIYHGKLHNTSYNSDEYDVEYEVGVSFSIRERVDNGNVVSDVLVTHQDYCRSTDVSSVDHDNSHAISNLISNKELISFDLSNVEGIALIQDGGIFFRLAEPVTEPGQYQSVVYFVLGTTT